MVFEVFMAVNIRIVIYWIITWCSSALKTGATGSSETVVNACGSRLCHNPDDDDPCSERRNPRSQHSLLCAGGVVPQGLPI
jgi:hypothetical protein